MAGLFGGGDAYRLLSGHDICWWRLRDNDNNNSELGGVSGRASEVFLSGCDSE